MTPEAHARLTELFGRAIELPAAARAGLLAQVRADDPALASELAALLAADEADEPAVRTGALAPTVTGRPAPDAAMSETLIGAPIAAASLAETLLPGAAPARAATPVTRPAGGSRRPRLEIPGYRILDVIGEGGMGTVYAGEQDAPRRPVAIKVLHAASAGALARFWAEAEIMARLDHGGIAKVLEAGEADGHPYFVMERVEGVTLDLHVAGADLTRARRLALFAALCDAIHHAHVKGVIHRDLKPSNVMVRADGRIAVLDFGIARVAAAGGSSGGETRAGELIGTPVYMSPEQARLRPDEVDARSDVYTLGVMLYELLTDELPYDVRGKGLPDVARAICHDPPRALSKRDPALRGDLEAICDKALAKEPERRYQSAAALGDDVRRHLDGATVSARVPGALEQVRRFARRRPGIAAAILGAVAASAAFAAIVTGLWVDATRARRLADAERTRVIAAHAELEDRTNQLVLDQARAALGRDPTASVALLRTLSARGVDPAEAWAIADEALGRGVAAEVRREHADEIRWVEATASGFVTGGYDGRALIWTAGEPAPRVLATVPGRVHAVRPAPGRRWFAIGGDGGVVRVVDGGGALVATLSGLDGDAEKMAWSPDGAWLAIGDDAGAVLVWTHDGGATRRLDGPRAEIESITFAADRPVLVAGTDDGEVWRWDLATGATAHVATGAEVLAVWAARDRVHAATADGRIHRWRFEAGQLAPDGTVAAGLTCKTAVFAPDGAWVVLGGEDGRLVRISDSGIEPLRAHPRQVRALAASADGRRLASASDDGLVQLWDLRTARHLALRGHAQRVRQLAFARDGGALLSADSDGAVRRWAIDRVPATVLDEHRATVVRLVASRDGTTLASADLDGELRRWDLTTGGGVRVGVHATRVTALAMVGATVVSAGADGSVVWWATPAGARQAAPGPVHALAGSADGDRVAAATGAGPIALFAGDGTPVAVLAGHAGGTDAVAISPAGTLIASGGQDRVVRVWRTSAPSLAPVELGPIDDDTRHVLFARGGELLVTAGDDGQVRAWTVHAGVVDAGSMRVLARHRGAVIALSGDGGDRLISVGRDRGRFELDLAGGVATALAPASRPTSDDVETEALHAVALQLPGAREVAVTGDGGAILIRDRRPRGLDALQTALAAPGR